MTRRGEIIGTSDVATEAEHYGKCPRCGAWVGRRDLGAVLEHNGPEPCPKEDRQQ